MSNVTYQAKVAIDPAKGVPQVEVIVGFANFGQYLLTFWGDQAPIKTIPGKSGDHDPDIFKADLFGADVNMLKNKYVTWTITIMDNQSKNYYTAIKVTQGEAVVGFFPYEDKLEGGAEQINDYMQIQFV